MASLTLPSLCWDLLFLFVVLFAEGEGELSSSFHFLFGYTTANIPVVYCKQLSRIKKINKIETYKLPQDTAKPPRPELRSHKQTESLRS